MAEVKSVIYVPAMRFRRPLAATYSGLAVLGLLGGAGFTLLSVVLFAFRGQCEPMVRIIATVVMNLLNRAVVYDYSPTHYYWIAGYVGFLACVWIMLAILEIVRKPAEDRRLNAALRQKMSGPQSHGAPLEPR